MPILQFDPPWKMAKEYKQEYERRRNSDKERKFYNTARWLKLRKMFLSRNPLCQKCLAQGIDKEANEVHHIVPLRIDFSGATKWDNLCALCKPCHSAETLEEQRKPARKR